MKNSSTLLILAAVTVAAMGAACAKSKNKSAQTQVDLAAAMNSSLAVPVPDRSYSVRDLSNVRPAGLNYSLLMASIIDPVAKGLKESNHHFSQAVTEGERKNGSTHIAHPVMAAELTGLRDDKMGIMKWSYAVGGTTYFMGTQRLTGLGGDLEFKPAGVSSSAFTVHYETINSDSPQSKLPSNPGTVPPAPPVPTNAAGVAAISDGGIINMSDPAQSQAKATTPVPTTGVVRHLDIVNATAGKLSFVATFTDSAKLPSLITMIGVIGLNHVSGTWTSTRGGSFTDLNGTLRCFDQKLQDVYPCSASTGK